MTYQIEVYEKSKGSRKLAYSEKIENCLDALFKLYDFVEKNDFEDGECYLFEKLRGGFVEIKYCDFHKLKNRKCKTIDLGGGVTGLDIDPCPLETIVLSEEQLDLLKKL